MSVVLRGMGHKTRQTRRRRRHFRVRKKVWGTAERPRLVVYRSLRNIEGQVVDDDAGQTLAGVSTLAPGLVVPTESDDPRKVSQARAAGRVMAEKALAAGVETVVFDRGGYRYHGRVKAFAEGAREGGLKF